MRDQKIGTWFTFAKDRNTCWACPDCGYTPGSSELPHDKCYNCGKVLKAAGQGPNITAVEVGKRWNNTLMRRRTYPAYWYEAARDLTVEQQRLKELAAEQLKADAEQLIKDKQDGKQLTEAEIMVLMNYALEILKEFERLTLESIAAKEAKLFTSS